MRGVLNLRVWSDMHSLVTVLLECAIVKQNASTMQGCPQPDNINRRAACQEDTTVCGGRMRAAFVQAMI